MQRTRRTWLKRALLGAGLLGLRSLATGLPKEFFLEGPTARANDRTKPDYLILATSQAGDPVNANCPGSYVPGANNNPDPRLAATTFRLGEHSVRAARCWGQLPAALRSRLTFFHHRTGGNAHPEYAKVMQGFGRIKGPAGNGQEHLASLLASEAAPLLRTIQTEPVALGRARVTYEGRALDNISAGELKELFAEPDDLGAQLKQLRDRDLDAMYAGLKRTGTLAQRKLLDRYAQGREQAARLGDQLSALLDRLPLEEEPGSAKDQALAAIALIQLNVAPVVTIHVPFGGDNHKDADLAVEAEQTLAAMESLTFLWDELRAAGLSDRTTVASINVFGRSLVRNAGGGRNHNAQHHCMFAFGPRVRPGIIGKVGRVGRDFGALAMQSESGQGGSGDVPASESMSAAVKSLGAALGLEPARLDRRVQGGKVIRAMLRG